MSSNTITKNDLTAILNSVLPAQSGGGGGGDVTGVKGSAESSYRTGNVNLSPSNIGAVPTTRTVNGKALSSDISLTASDVSALPSSTTIPTITDTYSGTSSNGMSGKAVKSAIDALDGTVSGTAGASKTLTAFSQTNGKVSATFGNISITKSQVSDFPTIPTAGTGSSYPAMDGTRALGSNAGYARVDHVHPTDTSRAPLASPAFTGTPTAPTATTGTATTQIATTEFVANTVEAMTSGVSDVQINGTSVVDDGVASVPIAKSDRYGVVKALYNNDAPAGVLGITFESALGNEITGYAPLTEYSNNTYQPIRSRFLPDATQLSKGAMTASDKTKLDGIASNATAVSVTRHTTSGTNIADQRRWHFNRCPSGRNVSSNWRCCRN